MGHSQLIGREGERRFCIMPGAGKRVVMPVIS